MKLNILFGGKAGQGANILTHILGEALVKEGYQAFYMRDYQSLIRGGHNFNVLTISDKKVHSNESKMDMIIAFDENTVTLHKKELKKGGIIIQGKHPNMYFAGMMFKCLGLSFSLLDKELKILKKKYETNIKDAEDGYNSTETKFQLPKVKKKERSFSLGTKGIADGAVKAGLDIYYAYPMTPATNVLGELSKNAIAKNYLVIELENEISVVNAGCGSAITGAKTMIGTSGGGFALMTEALSMCGIAEIPLVFYLAQRVGPASGVATYNAQGDLQMARHSGHGEFPRVILVPGTPVECEESVSEAFYLSQKFGVPSIVLSDKHLAESAYTTNRKPKITKSKKLTTFARFNSYEKGIDNCATEKSEEIIRNVENRKQKTLKLAKECEKFSQYKIYGNKNSKNVLLFWGSTKGAVLDSIDGLDVKAIQILYIEPFPKQIEKMIKDKNIILVENNSTGQLGDVVKEKTGITIKDKNKILKYDGRAFNSDELHEEIKRRLK